VSILILINPYFLSNSEEEEECRRDPSASEGRGLQERYRDINGGPVHRKLQPAVALKV
jgi:hypothetical protein